MQLSDFTEMKMTLEESCAGGCQERGVQDKDLESQGGQECAHISSGLEDYEREAASGGRRKGD